MKGLNFRVAVFPWLLHCHKEALKDWYIVMHG